MYTILLSMLITAASPQVEVHLLDGRTLLGTIADFDSQHLAIETVQGRESLTTAELLRLSVEGASVRPQQPARAWVELVDGSSVVGLDCLTEGETARMKLCDDSTIELPTAALATVRFQDAPEDAAAEWSRIVAMQHTTDVLVVVSGETLDYHRGVLHGVTDSTIEFDLDGDILPVPRSKVYGLIYYHRLNDDAVEPICRIVDTAGSRWSVETFEWGNELSWTTPDGIKRTQPLTSISEIDFSSGRIVFLSDLNPESVTYTPYFGSAEVLPLLGEFFTLREDRGLRSEMLQLGSKQYTKGLAMHSRTEVVYRLSDRFRRFRAVVGIDDAVRPSGNVRLAIYGDDRVLLQKDIAGTDPPEEIELDITGVRRIRILADFGGDGDVADHLDLCEARAIK
jgi:hypothetical protein